MKILLDKCVPNPLAKFLSGHEVVTFDQTAWDVRLVDSEVLRKAQEAGFDILVTTDQNLPYQQNLDGFPLALVILGSIRWPWIKLIIEAVADQISRAPLGEVTIIPIPRPAPSR